MSTRTNLSDAETRREAITEAALRVFAARGYASTPVTEVAERVGISQAYVFKLFPTKEALFLAAIERCYQRIEEAMASAADTATGGTPSEILYAIGEGYARLIVDKDLLMLQVHAQAATDLPAVREAVRDGMRRAVTFARSRTGAPDSEIQRFIAWGQLCHLVVTLGIVDDEADWARVLTEGLRHY
jgi:AcrR family transcriptional regulator